MRVLLVNPGIYVYGGAELLIVRLANYMTERGIENALLTTSILPLTLKDLKGTKIIIQKKPGIPFGEHIALHTGIRNNLNDFDVINVHNYPAELSIYPFHKPAVWMCNEPILYLNSSIQPFPRNLVNKIVLVFDKFVVRNYVKNVVVADEFNAARFENIYGIKSRIINYGIDYDFFSRGDAARPIEKFNLRGKFVVLHVGMLQPFKNQMESIRTIEKLKEKIPEIVLVLAGWGEHEYASQLKDYVKEKGLGRYVVFTGHLERENLRDLYHACDVLLHPIKSQGGWLSPFEALCARRPVVVSPDMTASGIITNEGIGVVTANFEEAVLDIYANPDKYDKIAGKGMIWVEQNLSWDKFCEKMVDAFYKSIADQSGRNI